MIINADDFGYSESVNRAICDCFLSGRINRTTIMVNMPNALDAAKIAKENGFFDKVGLHINLTEGKALSEICRKSELCDEDGFFKGTFHIPFSSRLYLDENIRKAIYEETKAQIEKFLEMGFTLMHADSHNYTHSYISVYNVVKKLLKAYSFTSVRISRNVPWDAVSLPFKIYKKIFNTLIKNLKINGKKVSVTKYFCSFQDYFEAKGQSEIKQSLEIMTHPDYIDGELIDNTLPKPHPFITREELLDKELVLEDVSGKKIKLLVCFIHAHIGGAMTSLVNFLNALDTEKYDVDVMFYENDSRHGIKKEINILPQGKVHQKFSITNIMKKITSPAYLFALVQDKYYKKVKKNKRKAVQIMSKQGCKFSRKSDKEYDVAVAYEFNWCMNYVIKRVNAKKKIIWNHVEYEKSGMDFKIDKKALDCADALVFVSEDCKESYKKNHPEHKDKLWFIPNLLSSEYVRNLGEAETVSLPFKAEESAVKFLTVARISFEHKGLDRAVNAFSRLKKEGILKDTIWTVIGDGRDKEKLSDMIEKEDLKDNIFLLGKKTNPIPYYKHFDAFLLPSRHEGKPMVVTESFIMGLCPVVTEYTSANEQIKNGVDGLVFDNNSEALYEGLKKILLSPEILKNLKETVRNTDYGNEHEIKEFDKMIQKI